MMVLDTNVVSEASQHLTHDGYIAASVTVIDGLDRTDLWPLLRAVQQAKDLDAIDLKPIDGDKWRSTYHQLTRSF